MTATEAQMLELFPQSLFNYLSHFLKYMKSVMNEEIRKVEHSLKAKRFKMKSVIAVNKVLNLTERIESRKRGVHFGVKSDLFSSQGATITVLVANIFLIFLIQWLFSFLKNNNSMRKYWHREKFHMASGQIINFIMPLTLPWTFVMLESGIKNFKTKINAACYLLIFFMGLFYPIYYFFELLGEEEGKLITERNAKRKERENTIRLQTKAEVF